MYCLHILHDQVHGSGHQLKDGEKWRIWGEDWFLEDNRWRAAFVFPPINIRFNDTIHQEIMVNGHLLSCKLWLECGDEKSWCQASLTSSLMASQTGGNTSSLKSLEFLFRIDVLKPKLDYNQFLKLFFCLLILSLAKYSLVQITLAHSLWPLDTLNNTLFCIMCIWLIIFWSFLHLP